MTALSSYASGPEYNLCLHPTQLAEVKVRILEAKQALEECISAQDFSRAAELKDSIMELENRRNQILKEIEESSHGGDREVRTEKVHNNAGNISLLLSGRFEKVNKSVFYVFMFSSPE